MGVAPSFWADLYPHLFVGLGTAGIRLRLTGRGDLQVALRRGATPRKMALRAFVSVGDLEIAARVPGMGLN
ncbi:hypothetical protein EV701_1595 [Chthoniobacter flavus]|nr:hypothetical protein EV701_1595 [Chthoniobacter flavus]